NANGAKLTLKNGSVMTKNRVGNATGGGEIIVDSGNYVSTTDGVFCAVGTGSKVTVNGGEISGQDGGLGAFDGAAIEVNGGEVTSADNFAIWTNGKAGRGGNTIVVNGGYLEGNIQTAGYEAIGVYIANNDTFIMNGGEIVANGGTGLCMRAGFVTINDGRITATNVNKQGEIVADGMIGDSSVVMTGCSAIIYHESANYPGKSGMELTVNGGTITGVDHAISVLSNEETPNVHVNGGTFTPAYPEP
ncbi:MAG: hypothetical protein IK088_05860, partial [Lachnospiraceae bacterium]|nr:hypothetical protein [Lachnospiraceae bacterium]